MPKKGRDDLRTPAKFDATRSGVGDRRARRMALSQRAADNSSMRLQYEQTVEILRYAASGGRPAHGLAPVSVKVSGMDNLRAVVGGFEMGETTINGEKRRQATRTFTIYGLPEWVSPNGSKITEVLLTDQIKYRDDVYDIVTNTYTPYSGRNVAICTLRVA